MIAGSASRSRNDVRVTMALAALLLAALGLRLYGLNWDDGRDLHPDELFIAKIVLIDRIHLDWPPDLRQLLDPATSGLNPRSADPRTGQYREFAYGALPLWVTDASGWALSKATGVDWNGPDRVYLVGRVLSALFDTGTVLLVFFLGRLLASDAVGLAGAAVAACAPMSIQLAHFFTTDSWLTFFVALCLVFSVLAALRGSLRWFVAAGLALGLAMATKGSVFSLAAPVAAALALDAHQRASACPDHDWRRALTARLVAAGIAAFVGFAAFEPYAIINPGIYLQSLRTQSDIVRGVFDVPFTRVYVGRPPILYQAEQLGRWGLGPAATLLAVVGLIWMAVDFWRRRNLAMGVLLAWFVAYGVVIAIPEVRFLRYLAPLVPVFAVASGYALVRIACLARRRFGRPMALAAVAAALAGVGLWAAAFSSIYAHENPRLAASRWIYANVPAGSAVTAEYWDDALPRDLGAGLTPGDRQYASVTMDLYSDQPPRQEAAAIYRDLQGSDYVVLSSDRVEAGTAQAPWRYPVQQRYYESLRSGALGFVPAATFQLAPSLGPLIFDDRDADESFINYDHPRVEIYRKTALISPDQYRQLMAPAVAAPWVPTRHPPAADNPMLSRPVGDLPVVDDAGWSAALTSQAGPALLVWIVLLVVLQAIGTPIARTLLPRFADGGWGLARLFAILLGGYLVWIGASVGAIEFRAVWCFVAVGALAVGAWLLLRRSASPAAPDRANVIAAEAVFWVVFALFLAFRFLNPDSWHPIWGGEKPMEFAHLNATLRSANFPPYDPWYAGGILNYYYYGLYLVAFLLKLTGIPSRIGFNLAQPTVIALLASGAYSVAASLGRDASRVRRLAVPAGLAGVVLTVLIGNLTSALALFQPARPALDSFLDWVWAGSRAIPDAITEFPFFTGLYADLHAHVVALPMTVAAIALSYDLARRPLRTCPDRSVNDVARMVLAAIGRLAPLMLVIGGLSATNAWDVPTYAALGLAALFMATRQIAPWPRRMVAFVLLAGVFGAGSYLLFLPFHQHFVALFGSLARVKAPTDLGAWASHVGGLLAIVAASLIVLSLPAGRALPGPIRSPLAPVGAAALLIAIGIVLGPTAPAAATVATTALVALALGVFGTVAWTAAGSLPGVLRQDAILVRAWVVIGLGAAAIAFFAGWDVLALYLGIGTLAAARWMIGRRAAPRFVALLAAAAAFVGAGVELFVIADDLIATTAYRMNTVFKFYNQIWVLLALAAAAGLTVMLRASGLLRRPRATPTTGSAAFEAMRASGAEARDPRRSWATAGIALAVVVMLASLVYPVLAVSPRLHQRFTDQLGTGALDALDWMRYGTVPSFGPNGVEPIHFDGDLAAIDWLQRNVAGSPVIAEASIGPYRCDGSRFSIATGLPTIIGWERHEEQQRPPDDLPQRVNDVRTLYTSPDPAEKLAILRKYDVRYVIVGDLERLYPVADNDCTPQGSAAGIAAFDAMVGTSLEPVFNQGGTTIYRVLPAGASTT